MSGCIKNYEWDHYMNSRLLYVGFALVGILFPLGCSGENTENFEPLFTGLKAGQRDQQDCVSIADASVKIEFNDFDQNLNIYRSKGCKESSKANMLVIPVEAQLAGMWNGFVVLDEGTDVNGREIHLISINDATKKYSIYYVNQPLFEENQVTYFEATEKEAKLADCAEQAPEVTQWNEMGFPLMIAQQKILDIKTGKTRSTDVFSCYPLQ
jgi:hypothetical protein